MSPLDDLFRLPEEVRDRDRPPADDLDEPERPLGSADGGAVGERIPIAPNLGAFIRSELGIPESFRDRK